MASSTPSDAKKLSVSRTRPLATASPGNLTSPHTPLSRSVSASLLNSPSANFRVDEECLLIFEIGARTLRAGIAGEASPRCHIAYHPDQLRRLADYRHHLPDYHHRNRKSTFLHQAWGHDGYQLWHPDLRDQDLNYIGHRLERLLRQLENSHLLLDSRPRRVALVAAPQLAKPLLELAIASLFTIIQSPTVTLFPANAMSVVAAGLRSALVVDIGWAETSVSAVFELREVLQKHTTRAAKAISYSYAKLAPSDINITVDEAEDIMIRLGWCRPKPKLDPAHSSHPIHIHLPSLTFQVTRDSLADPPEQVLFATGTNPHDSDDDDLPLHRLVYFALLQLPIDVRESCMSRIIVTGGLSNMPGLKSRLLYELEQLIETRSWNPIRNYGSVGSGPNLMPRKIKSPPVDTSQSQLTPLAKVSENTELEPESQVLTLQLGATHLLPQEEDSILAKLRKRQQDANPTPTANGVRGVNSLGAWAGASLMSNFRVRGIVEIEREKFMAAGLVAGATKRETSVAAQRQSLGPGLRPVAPERSSWNLGIWA